MSALRAAQGVHPTLHLWRVVGCEEPLRGREIVERIRPADHTMLPDADTLTYIARRKWSVVTLAAEDIPAVDTTRWKRHEHAEAERYRGLLAAGRPVEAIVIADDRILEGQYRAFAARLLDVPIAAYLPHRR